MEKHVKIHTQKFVQYCHYYNNDKFCPYEELDCKFLHQVDNDCKFGKKCNKEMCPKRHSEEEQENNGDKETDTAQEYISDNDEDNETVSMNESFVTSTPQKIKYKCKECENQHQCTDCYVRQHEETGYQGEKVDFKDYSRETY